MHDSDWEAPAASACSADESGEGGPSSPSLFVESVDAVLLSRLLCRLRAAAISGASRLHNRLRFVMSDERVVRNGW